MSTPLALLAGSLALTGFACSRPSHGELSKKYAAEIERADTAMRTLWTAVSAAPAAEVGAPCEKPGLTLGVAYPTGSGSSRIIAGTAELVMLDNLTLRYDREHWSGGKRVDVPDFIDVGPFSVAADFARSQDPADKESYEGEPERLEASRTTTHVIAIRDKAPATFEAFLFDVAAKTIVCSFRVDGAPDANAVDTDYVTTGRDGTRGSFTTSDVAASAARNAPRALEAELLKRFGIGFKPGAGAKTKAPVVTDSPDVVAARRQAAALYAQRDQPAPPCREVDPKAQALDLDSLRTISGDTTPPAPDTMATGLGTEKVANLMIDLSSAEARTGSARTFATWTRIIAYGGTFTAPQPLANGAWSPGRLKAVALHFVDGKLACRRDWELVTPDDLEATTSHGSITAETARRAARGYFADMFKYRAPAMPVD